MTTKQLAGYLQLNELTIYKLVRIGKIPFIKLGKALRFKRNIIDRWLELESGWDEEFESLLRKTRLFGRQEGITEQKIEEATREERKRRK